MLKFSLLFLTLLSFSVSEAFAYIDPGTGSSFLHIIMAFFAAAGASVIFFWNKLLVFFKSIFGKK